ncbi:MAG: TrmH family RNA methyltransferase [bacterium]|nr:TrmH family RNA methyltransferase [bacterium]
MRNKKNRELVLIIHNVRSAYNVGALFRTADGAGVKQIFLIGYTPAPPKKNAPYLTRAEKELVKTALGAEKSVLWKKSVSLRRVLTDLRKEGFVIVALEQCEKSVDFRKYVPKSDVALILGNEVRGIDAKILKRCDAIIEIPMHGKKNSLNVSVAGGIALYQITGTMGRGR